VERKPIPNLFVIGAAKAGTTSLCELLATHSEIFLPAEKEPHFFLLPRDGSPSNLTLGVDQVGDVFENSRFALSFSQYQHLFLAANCETYRIDGSTQYFVSDTAARQIADSCPDAKLIIQLREPFSRAWSAYCFAYSKGEESRSFVDAIDEEVSGKRRNRFYGGYLNTSNYAPHIRRYLNHFPRRNIYISFFEDFVRSDSTSLEKLYDFLGLPAEPTSITTFVGNPTLYTPNRMLRYLRQFGVRARQRHRWIGDSAILRIGHRWILAQSRKAEWLPTASDRELFYSHLERAPGFGSLSEFNVPDPYASQPR